MTPPLTACFVAAIVLYAGGALIALRAAWRGSAVARRALATKTTRIKDLREGPVEVVGVLSAGEDTVTSPSGKRCVFAKVTIAARTEKSTKSTTVSPEQTFVRIAKNVMLRDESGSVALDLEHAEIVASTRTAEGPRGATADKSWLSHVPADGLYVIISEVVIEDGQRAVVDGRAAVVGSELTARDDEAGYRGATPKETRRFRIAGRPNERMVVSQGSEVTLLLRGTWPVVVLLVIAALLSLHVTIMVYLVTT